MIGNKYGLLKQTVRLSGVLAPRPLTFSRRGPAVVDALQMRSGCLYSGVMLVTDTGRSLVDWQDSQIGKPRKLATVTEWQVS